MSNCFSNVTIIPYLARRNPLYCKHHAKVSTVQRPELVKSYNRNPLNISNSLAHVTPSQADTLDSLTHCKIFIDYIDICYMSVVLDLVHADCYIGVMLQ